jgi:beta-lactam-binding protein with PASTA domain
MKKIFLIISLFILFTISLVFSFKTFEAFFFNKYLIKTPNLKNLTFEEAGVLLHNSGLKLKKMGEEYSDVEEGRLYSQIPLPNKKIKRGRVIKVWVSKGKNSAVVPDFKNMNLLDAKVLAEQKGFDIKNISYVEHKLKYNRVITTDPPNGSLVSGKKEINFLVSLGQKEDNVRMPDIIGLGVEDARTLLKQNQIFIGNIKYIESINLEKGVIIESSIPLGDKIPAGSTVDITATK